MTAVGGIKSVGHIAWLDLGENEAFEFNGEVFISPTSAPLAPNGYRQAPRWECSVGHWKRFYAAVFSGRVIA